MVVFGFFCLFLQAVHGLSRPGAGVSGQPGHVQPHPSGPDGEVCRSQRPTGHRQEPHPVHAGSETRTIIACSVQTHDTQDTQEL